MRKFIVLLAFVGLIVATAIPILLRREQLVFQGSDFYGMTVVLDPGHGGKDGGASSKSGLVEKDIALAVTQKVESHLRLHGFNVVLSRDGDYDLASPGAVKRKREDLNNRARLFNAHPDGIGISIHLNATTNERWKGAQTFYQPGLIENKQLATAIMERMNHNLDGSSREAKAINDILILKHSQIPTALVEIGFLSNPEEAELLGTEAYQREVAYAIYEGIISFLSSPPAAE